VRNSNSRGWSKNQTAISRRCKGNQRAAKNNYPELAKRVVMANLDTP
jgi:hypothetical protein